MELKLSAVLFALSLHISLALGDHRIAPRAPAPLGIGAGGSIWGNQGLNGFVPAPAVPRANSQWNNFRSASVPRPAPVRNSWEAPRFVIRRPASPMYQARVRNPIRTTLSRPSQRTTLSWPSQRTTLSRPPLNVLRNHLQSGHRKIFFSSPSTLPPTTTTTTTASPTGNSFLRILQQRQTVIRNDQDSYLIMFHLYELYKIGLLDGFDSDVIMDMQVDSIENISDELIKREVLKIFVKDMVEKSGFLRRNVTAKDMDAISALIDRIGLITSDVNVTDPPTEVATVDHVFTFMPTFTNFHQTSTDITNSFSNFNDFQSTTSTPVVSRKSTFTNQKTFSSVNPSDFQRLSSYAGRRRPSAGSSLVGMSIFGPEHITKRETTTVRPSTTEEKRDKGVLKEQMGGNSSYWTHLRAGLVDILCALCQQQGRQACVKRYCNNDSLMVRKGATTPSTNSNVVS